MTGGDSQLLHLYMANIARRFGSLVPVPFGGGHMLVHGLGAGLYPVTGVLLLTAHHPLLITCMMTISA
jgi:hypothetical protein